MTVHPTSNKLTVTMTVLLRTDHGHGHGHASGTVPAKRLL